MSVAALASAQAYKWVDERGVTHYGEQPPQGAKVTQVPNSIGTPAPESAPRADDYQQKDLEFRQRRIQAEAAEERQRYDAARQREQCNHQRDTLARLRSSRRMYSLNESGERVYMDDAGRDTAIARQEQLVTRVCKS